MNRTSIKNKLILSFLALLLIVMVVVGATHQFTDDVITALGISVALALFAGIIFGGIFSKSIVKRLNSLSSVAREISHGDLSKDIPFLSSDEIRDLEEVFAAMVNDLRGIISEIQQVSAQIEKTGRELGIQIDKVLINSREIDESALAIAKGSETQSLIIQKTSLVLDRSLEQMEDAATQSARTASKANDARLKTETGEANARETLHYLEEVLKQMGGNADPVYRLSGKVEKIKMVMSVIEELSRKTDLLSLNASIEATRAGEMGKGFALVANEIRNMAENSRNSSHQIRAIVDDIFEDNRAVLEALKKSEEDINKGRGIIHGIVGTFGEMLSGVKEISSEVKEVGDAARKQVREIRGLFNQVQELSRLAQENFVSTQKTTIGTKNQKEELQEIVRAANALNGLSQKMMETQQRFRLRRA
ncbi:MAG: methyl-accepting chemotaxis protein [Deltaproteobacteria bacterium]|nr:methyl-accepting chemotaxis protein [Deltaproteobacteria bacterium]